MAQNEDGSRKDQDRDWEVERYRRAAEDALQQLDWCIGYLHGIRKLQVSRALSKNRSYIRSRLMEREEQPLPAERTKQT
jgi:hypothetical protein